MIKKVVFIGSKELGLMGLEAMSAFSPSRLCSVVTIDDRQCPRSSLAYFKRFCAAQNKRLHVLSAPSRVAEVLDEERPDLCLVIGWYWLFPESVLRPVPHGFLAVHASLLPKYRGFSPLVWAILNAEKASGVSLFYLDREMDTGDIVAQKKFSIGGDETIAELLDKAGGVAVEIIREQYPLILAGKARRIRQDHRRATYCSLRGPDDARIDWRASNAQVHNLIRAQSPPYPGAFSYAPDGSKIYILKSVLCGSGYFGVPGMVAQVCTDCAVVCCGSGAIRVYAVGLSPLRPQPSSGLLKFGMRMV